MSDLTLTLQWTTEKRKVKDLVPYNYNPRILTPEKKQLLINSIEKFNLAEIPAVNTDNVIIAGHQRIKVLMELGKGEDLIDVRIPSRTLTEKEFKEYNITSNVPTGYWDLDVLSDVFDDIDLDALGLNVDEIVLPEDIIPEEFRTEEEEPFEPELPTEPITKFGDVYELTSLDKNITHKIICGDSTKEETYIKLLGKDKIDCVVTDPPYNVDYVGGVNTPREGIKNDKMKDDNFYNFLFDFYKQVFSFLKEGGSIYVFHADTEGINFRSAFVNSGLKLSQCLIWSKNTFAMSRSDYHWQHEPCLYGWKPGAAHKWFSDRKQSTILEYDKPLRSDEHPTMKPLPLIGYLLCNSTQKNSIVFDGFLGSGTTLISCEKNWRICRGVELDEKYVDVDVKRWVKYMRDNNRNFEVKRNGQILAKETINQFFINE
ncbi:DNA modification methylase [Tenacibaculum soleae]|uniref:DNA modification methylase n=1 Tax=Tenacibaculum soleae TaxID=447689 RepID=UPI0026E423C5|nr:DNA modification methylase [Tenacibaculum soleae]MDO6813817.1 DNA modification methylase [Tenacibaculum soleae]